MPGSPPKWHHTMLRTVARRSLSAKLPLIAWLRPFCIRVKQDTRIGLPVAVSVLLPLCLWGWLVWDRHAATLRDAKADQLRAVEALAQYTERLLTTQALVLDILDKDIGTRDCAAMRTDQHLQSIIQLLASEAPQSRALWAIDRDGFLCVSSDPMMIDHISRADRDYFESARKAGPGHFVIGRATIGRIDGLPIFNVAKARGINATFNGVVLASPGLGSLIRDWNQQVGVTETEHVAALREDGVTIARSWPPVIPEPDPPAEAWTATLWSGPNATALRGAETGVWPLERVVRIGAWRRLPRWGVILTSSISVNEALAPWRRATFEYALVALLASALCGTVTRQLLIGQRILARAVDQRTSALRESEARLEMAAEAGGIGIWDWNLQDNSFVYSERAKKICGFLAGQPVTYQMVKDVTHPEDFPRTSALARKALDPDCRADEPYEYRIIRTDGQLRWVLARGVATFANVHGALKAVRYVGTIQDITERKQVEEALRENDSRLRLAIDAGRMAVWEHHSATDTISSSPALFRVLGFSEGATPTVEDIRARYAPGERERLRQAARAVLDRGDRHFEIEYGYLWPDGSVHWLALRAEFILEDGVPVRTVGVVTDVTDRMRIESELRKNEAELRDLLATIDLAAVFVREWGGRLRFWSRGCERLFGWTAAEVVGRTAHDLLLTSFPIPFSEIQAQLLERGEWEGDLLIRHRGGRVLTVSVRKVLRQACDGHPPLVMESLADVTALRDAEAELRLLNQNLDARVRAEVKAREAAQSRAAHAERVQALGQLAGGIAHDFNNVLQSITSGVSMIERRATEEDSIRVVAKMVLEAAKRGAAVTRRLLVFARRSDLTSESIDPLALFESLKEMLEPTFGKRITIIIDVASGTPPLLADRSQLETALVNLAVNARDAMPEGGTITLGASAQIIAEPHHKAGVVPGSYVAVTVADVGTGIDQSLLVKVTEPFFTTKPSGEGTGLGLAMTRAFVEQSGGGLDIESAPDKGTKVTLWLPAAKQINSAGAVPSEEATNTAPFPASVLFVDDDDGVRESLARELQDRGCNVQTAQSGEAALEQLRAGAEVDCLITDLSMPGMNGVSLVRAARVLRPDLPAIILTGYAGHWALEGEHGDTPYTVLWKPIDPAWVVRHIRELLTGERLQKAAGQSTALV